MIKEAIGTGSTIDEAKDAALKALGAPEDADVKYDVLVSENVIFQEFYDKYEILEAKGQIYTVKEIEAND